VAEIKVELVQESMNDSIYRYNSPTDTDVYIGSELEQAIHKSTNKLMYCKREGYVYEIGYDNYWREQVVFKYPYLWKRGLPEENQDVESPSGLRVVEWH